ncbi:MAG: S8 family serine peptidase [Candidatus Heimdallarchaeota archaeon]|nr:S8 family serine peptidase [Candidatus Heimdallarchaeota archaeon]
MNDQTTINLVAPVGDFDGSDDQVILSTYKNGGYAYSTGTSLACPQVSAVIALMKSINPNLSVENITTILQETAIDLGPSGWDNNFGHGLLNASAALHECNL